MELGGAGNWYLRSERTRFCYFSISGRFGSLYLCFDVVSLPLSSMPNANLTADDLFVCSVEWRDRRGSFVRRFCFCATVCRPIKPLVNCRLRNRSATAKGALSGTSGHASRRLYWILWISVDNNWPLRLSASHTNLPKINTKDRCTSISLNCLSIVCA